ncbi:MAG: LysR family transcriptional regulator [Cyanobacteria bacterium P01_C01_bin.89]
MDKLEAMRAFVQVVESGGFAAAARQMMLTRSTVNKAVIALEKQLGAQLLQRSTRQVSVTAAGCAYYDRCVAILADLSEADQAIAQLQIEPQGVLRVNAPMSFGISHLAPAIADFMAHNPKIQVDCILNDRTIDPIEEGFDVTVRISSAPPLASLTQIDLASVPLNLCAAPRYLNQHAPIDNPRTLQSWDCLHYGYRALCTQWRLAGPDGEVILPIRPRLCSNNGEVLRDAAIAGQGVALLPEFMVQSAMAAGQLTAILPDYCPTPLTLSALYPSHRYLSVKVKRFVEFLGDRFGNLTQ